MSFLNDRLRDVKNEVVRNCIDADAEFQFKRNNAPYCGLAKDAGCPYQGGGFPSLAKGALESVWLIPCFYKRALQK